MRWEYKDCVPRGALFPASLWNHGPAVCSVTIFWRLGNRAAGRKGIGRSHGGTSCQSTCQKTVLQIIKRAVWAQGGLCEWTIDTIVTLIRQYYSSRISVQSGNSHQGFIYWYKQGCEDETTTDLTLILHEIWGKIQIFLSLYTTLSIQSQRYCFQPLTTPPHWNKCQHTCLQH